VADVLLLLLAVDRLGAVREANEHLAPLLEHLGLAVGDADREVRVATADKRARSLPTGTSEPAHDRGSHLLCPRAVSLRICLVGAHEKGHHVRVSEPDLRGATVLTTDSVNPLRCRAHISDEWAVESLYGGLLMHVALRAMTDALCRPDLSVLTATALFLAPVPAGPVVIDIDVLRVGRTTAQLAARVGVPDSTGAAVHVHGVFGSKRSADLAFQPVRCPVVPPPDAVAVRRHSPLVHVNFDDRSEWRPISGIDDPKLDKIVAWERLRVGEPDLLSLTLHSDFLGLAVQQQGPFIVLSLDLAVRFIATPATSWVLQEMEAWHVGDGYATGPGRLWDEHGRLCAIVNQTGQLRPMPGA
jgi:acyl-CoA thioesterase